MTCIKTGFTAILNTHGEYLHGDAYQIGKDAIIFRICSRSREPIQDRINFRIDNFVDWFDEKKTSMQQNSTMVALAGDVAMLSYDGVPYSEAVMGDHNPQWENA